MKNNQNITDYWFVIEPFVFVSCINEGVLLYNTLDGTVVTSDKSEVISLIKETLQESNSGVLLLENSRYEQKNIYDFIKEIREKYMGDIIDISLSKCKPVQLLPYCDYIDKKEICKKDDFLQENDLLKNLCEVTIYVDTKTILSQTIYFIKPITGKAIVNIVYQEDNISQDFLRFLFQINLNKRIICPYANIVKISLDLKDLVSYQVLIDFPIDEDIFIDSIHRLSSLGLSYDCMFRISSKEEYEKSMFLISYLGLKKYQFDLIYTGNNLQFFKDFVFLEKEDILSTVLTMKDFLLRKSINICDFGKINILSNGDVYANLNYPVLGNIQRDSIYDIVQKEISDGESWFRIRNQLPCSNCIYQWLCPSPSNYEIVIGRSNLCHIK